MDRRRRPVDRHRSRSRRCRAPGRGRARGRTRRRSARDARPRGSRAGGAGVRRAGGSAAACLPSQGRRTPARRPAVPASGGAEVVAEYTPGHSSDHVAFFVPAEGALFTGDAVVGRGTSFIDPPDGDLVQYLRRSTACRSCPRASIYPGHGPIVMDARAKLGEYIAHREDRERQVLELLASGPANDPRSGRRDLCRPSLRCPCARGAVRPRAPAEARERRARGAQGQGGGGGVVEERAARMRSLRPAGQGPRAAVWRMQLGGAAGHRGGRRLDADAVAAGSRSQTECASRRR